MRFLITGATGYIGQRLIRQAQAQGHQVIAASRRLPAGEVEWVSFDFSSSTAFRLPADVDVVFHLAAVTSLTGRDDEAELRAARQLVQSATGAQAKFVFVSSQTARNDAPTPYGKTKRQIEKLVLAAGGVVVRPGQVYGGPELGLFGALVRIVRDLPLLPAFFPPPRIQPVHVDDLAFALMQCALREDVTASIVCIGAQTPISFTQFLKAIADTRVCKGRLWVPVPARLVRLAARLVPTRPGAAPALQRLTSLFDLPPMDTADDMAKLGVALRPLGAGMRRSGDDRRRGLVAEGRALLAYVLRARPAPALVRRYVRCVERLGPGLPLGLPPVMLRRPSTLALLDGTSSAAGVLDQRLNAAVLLAEASTQGSARFLSIGARGGPVLSLMRIAGAVILELAWRVLRIFTGPAWKPSTAASKPAK